MEKNSILYIPCTAGTAGGSKRGSIKASFAQLERMFGDPAFEGKGDNITTEFVIDYEWYDPYGDLHYGSFSLYDWHYARNFGNDYEEITWNIGGKSFNDWIVVDYAMKLFEKDQGYDACLAHANWHDTTPFEEADVA
jgi:hypothetical protein